MKELTDFELVHIDGGKVSPARAAGRAVGDFLAYCTACAVYTADVIADIFKSMF